MDQIPRIGRSRRLFLHSNAAAIPCSARAYSLFGPEKFLSPAMRSSSLRNQASLAPVGKVARITAHCNSVNRAIAQSHSAACASATQNVGCEQSSWSSATFAHRRSAPAAVAYRRNLTGHSIHLWISFHNCNNSARFATACQSRFLSALRLQLTSGTSPISLGRTDRREMRASAINSSTERDPQVCFASGQTIGQVMWLV